MSESKDKGQKATAKKAAAAQPQEVPNPDGNTGPQTGTPAPEDKTQGQYPADTRTGDAAPLDPKAVTTDHEGQVEPREGHNLSSTDPVYAEAGGRTVAGEDFVGLVGEDDEPLSSDGLFEEVDGSKTFVLTKQRISEVFYYPGTTEKAKRLVFAKGKRVPRAQAERIKAAVDAAPKPLVEQQGKV